MGLTGLSKVNIELTSRCGKTHLCAFCGHQDKDINPNLKYGDMSWMMLTDIRRQLPRQGGLVVAFHRDGEPTDYPNLGNALNLFSGLITSIVTHGLNLEKKAYEIIGACTSLTVSVFHNDPDRDAQLSALRSFLNMKGELPPMTNVKIVGEMPEEEVKEYQDLGVQIIRRLLHVPDGNYRYIRREPTIPEHGICLDFLGNPAIDWQGRVFVCVRLDPDDKGYLGDLRKESLEDIWNGVQRKSWLIGHLHGRRDLASPLCRTCTYYGVPSA